MFNRSIKYILLLCVNIIVLLVLYLDEAPDEPGVFDTQFVISLLEERDELQSLLIEANIRAAQCDIEIEQLKNEIRQINTERQTVNSQ